MDRKPLSTKIILYKVLSQVSGCAMDDISDKSEIEATKEEIDRILRLLLEELSVDTRSPAFAQASTWLRAQDKRNMPTVGELVKRMERAKSKA
jgi:hypothetical protein